MMLYLAPFSAPSALARNASDNPAPAGATTTQARVLRAGTVPNELPPFLMQNADHQVYGIAADYTVAVAAHLGRQLEWVSYPNRAQMYTALRNEEIDVIPAAFARADTTDWLFSKPYAPNKLAQIERRLAPGQPPAAHPRIAYVPSLVQAEKLAPYYPSHSLQPYPTALQALLAVSFGEADRYVGNLSSASYQIDSMRLLNLQITNFAPMDEAGFAFAVNRKQSALLLKINETLATLSPEFGTEARIRWEIETPYVQVQAKVQLTPTEQAWVSAHPRILVGVLADQAPATFLGGDGQAHGLTIDILSLLGQRTGLRFDPLMQNDSAMVIQDLHSGRSQMAGSAITDKQPGALLTSAPYTEVLWAIVSPRGVPGVNGVLALKDKRVTLVNGSPVLGFLEHHPAQATVDTAPSAFKVLERLARRDSDAAILPMPVANYLIGQHFSQKLEVTGVLSQLPQPVAFSFNNTTDGQILRNIVDKGLASIGPNEHDEIERRWYLQSHPELQWTTQKPRILGWLGALSLAVAGLGGWVLVFWRQIKLRRKAESRLADELTFQRAFLEAIPMAIFVRDAAGKLVSGNRVYRDFMGTDMPPMVGASLNETPPSRLGPPQAIAHLKDIYQRTLRDGQINVEDLHFEQDGRAMELLHWVAPFTDANGNRAGLVGGWVDITERTHLEQRLAQARDTTERARRALATFLASMSHEIRTPMNAIIGLLELEIERPEDAATRARSLTAARDAARHLLVLIDDILDMSKIEADQLSLTPRAVLPGKLISDIARIYEGVARQKKLQFHERQNGPNDVWINADPVRLRQVLGNLLSNAVKFTRAGAVTLTSQITPTAHGKVDVTLTIQDTGIGIEASELERIFLPFSQSGMSMRGDFEGTGLGLPICRRLVQMMGGDLTVTSQPGQGSTFTVALNFDIAPAEPQTQGETMNTAEIPDMGGLPVLIVDDHPANRMVLKKQLEFFGCRVTEANDGLQGLQSWQQQPFALVITDCFMPVMSGEEMVRTMRQQEAAGRKPVCRIIGLTANSQPGELDAAIAAGMDECLVKPVGLDTWRRKLGEQLAAVKQAADPLQANHASDSASLPLYDVATLTNLFAGDAALTEQFIATLVSSNNDDFARAVTELANGNIEELGRALHKIKGAARLIDASSVVDLCEQIATLARAGDVAHATSELTVTLARQLEQLARQLQKNTP